MAHDCKGSATIERIIEFSAKNNQHRCATPVGIKVLGADLNEIERLGSHLEMILREVPGTRSVFAERTGGGYFLDFVLNRDQLARYGLTIKEAEMELTSAVGGEPITTTVEGRERYTINVRYACGLRLN